MYGVVNGIQYNNLERTHELDTRLSDRNIPSTQLQSVLDMRPVSTKYDLMSIVDRKVIATVPLINRPTYDMSSTFNPGNIKSPWSGYAVNVNDESNLRNQFFSNQSNAQSHFIPSSESNMYKVKIDEGNTSLQPYPNLFKKEDYNLFDPSIDGVGNNVFFNYTRQQLKDL